MNKPTPDRSSKPATQPTSPAEKLRYNVMQPVHREGRDKPFWQRLGTAWLNAPKNGSPPSVSIKLDALPMGGELVLFAADAADEE